MARLTDPRRAWSDTATQHGKVCGNLHDSALWVFGTPSPPDPAAVRRWAIYIQVFARDILEVDMFARMLGVGGV